MNTIKQLHSPSSINQEKDSGTWLPGIQRRCGQFEENKNFLPLPGICLKTRSLVFAHCSCCIQRNCLWQDAGKTVTLLLKSLSYNAFSKKNKVLEAILLLFLHLQLLLFLTLFLTFALFLVSSFDVFSFPASLHTVHSVFMHCMYNQISNVTEAFFKILRKVCL